jgi:hypothetical protein
MSNQKLFGYFLLPLGSSVLGGGSPSNARVMGCTCGGSPSDRVPTYEHTTVNGLVLGGVPDNARVMGCTCGGSPSDPPPCCYVSYAFPDSACVM